MSAPKRQRKTKPPRTADCTVQYAAGPRRGLPAASSIRAWAAAVVADQAHSDCELTVRFVSSPDMAAINRQYRRKSGPTNVLSFPAPAMDGIPGPRPLGDVLICPAVALAESREQGKTARAHFAHLVVHGILHLLGHDHQKRAEAEVMESLERRILGGLGFDDPYRTAGE